MPFTAVLLLAGLPLIGLLTRSPAVVVLALIAWPLYLVGVDQQWWGQSTGEFGYVSAFFVMVGGVALTGFAVETGRFLWGRLGSRA